MDLTAFDITDVDEIEVMATPWIEMFGENIEIDDVARSCGTIGYELLVSLGNRAARNYTGMSENQGRLKLAKNKIQFICQNCGSAHPRWGGKCDGCGAWNTLVEENTLHPVLARVPRSK